MYLYHPANVPKASGERPLKRRKVVPEKQSENTTHPFVPLLDGDETAASVETRYNFYQKLWSEQETKIQVSWATLDKHTRRRTAPNDAMLGRGS